LKDSDYAVRAEIRRRDEADPPWERPFLSVHRLTVSNVRADGTRSAGYAYDAVLRVHLDAVALLLTSGEPRRPEVLLRACIRPPLLLRAGIEPPVPEAPPTGVLWELPAGLIEPADRGIAGIRRRAAAEALEETGYHLPVDAFTILPGAPFVTPGTLPERLHFARAHVRDASARERPRGDGSLVEEGARIRWVTLDEALASCDAGEIEDMKTELGLRRLAELTRATGEEVNR
jgi:ADP-ribose pyrophosphatase